MKRQTIWLYLLSASIYFTQGSEGIVNLPFFFYLKENLHLNESQIMFYSSFISLAWLIKIFWGYLADNFLTKKSWIIISLIGSLIISIFIGINSYIPLLLLIAFMAIGSATSAIRDTNIDALACVEGKKYEITGKLQSVQWSAITVASLLTGVVGGYIAQNWNYQISYLVLIPIYLIIIAIVMQYKSSETVRKKDVNLLHSLKEVFIDKRLLLVCLFLFLYKFSPGFGTPLTFIIQDKFHFSKQFIGIVDTIGAGVSLIGAGLYFKYSKKINLTKWLFISTFISAITTLFYLYFTSTSCIVYTILFSILGMFFNLLLLDFMARNTKSGYEAISFALLCSVSNLASTCNGFLGSWLFPIIGLQWLIIISALASFICLPLISKFKEK